MVTNLPAEAKAKWLKYLDARTTEEKIKALEEFLSSVPKHKGTENLREWATRKLAELREELEERRRRRVGGQSPFSIKKEGAGQAIFLGLPQCGKSSLVRALTGAKTKVANYPFATTQPVVGSLRYEDIYFQLIDAPPLAPGSKLNGKVIGLAKNADLAIVVLDATRDVMSDYKTVVDLLEENGLTISKPRGRVVLERYRAGKAGVKVTVLGKMIGATPDDVRRLLESYNIYNAHVKLYGEVTLDDVEAAIFERNVYKPAIITINKADLGPDARRKAEELSRRTGLRAIPVSALTREGLDLIARLIFEELEIVRVYTKPPNGPPSPKPLVLRRGSTVFDVARNIHSELVENFSYARVWGRSAKYPGERVGLDHEVLDGDIVEIHTK
ncbi:MAG: TGS domain-containing protein [Desulfurococcaceae archaeon]